MDVELVPLSDLSETNLKQLAVLHHGVMPTLLTDLGLPIVLRYYQIARRDSSVLGISALDSSHEVIGWVTGSPHPDKINSQLRSPLSWFVLQMLRVIITRPRILMQLLSSVLFSSAQMEMNSGAIELTYIGVAPSQRGKDLGKDLLNQFIKTSGENGYRSIVLSVETDNKPAIALYEKSGFKITRTYSEGRYQRHRMELILE